jgi:hypothetical protein
MFSIKSFFIAGLSLLAIIFSSYSAEQNPSATASGGESAPWVPVDEADWAIYMDAPRYHFDLAREYLKKGDYSKAAAELKEGNSFLLFQEKRLGAASKQIEELSKRIATGKYNDLDKVDAVTSGALNVIINKYAMVPVDVVDNSVFEQASNYHFEKAKSKLRENDSAGAASEIRRVGSFLKLRAASMSNEAREKIDEIAGELNELASKVKDGLVKDKEELDRLFHKAMLIFSKKKE